MTSCNRFSREAREKEKAGWLFMTYKFMGPGRSLMKLFEQCTTMGLKISENTLKRYSVKYEWQRRLLELESQEAERREREVGILVDDMNRQDAAMAQGMKALVVSGIRWHRDRMRRTAQERIKQGLTGDEVLDMDFRDIAHLGRAAQQIERLARGQATSRTEVWVEVASTVVREFVLIFMAVNEIVDPIEREHEFLRLGDEMMTRYYSETTRRQLEAGQGQ